MIRRFACLVFALCLGAPGAEAGLIVSGDSAALAVLLTMFDRFSMQFDVIAPDHRG